MSNGITSRHLAAGADHASIIELLLSHNANVNHMTEKNETALHFAARNGHVGVINELLKAKSIIVDLPDNHKMTPLSIAARKRHTAEVAALPKQIIDCQRRLVSNADSARDKLP